MFLSQGVVGRGWGYSSFPNAGISGHPEGSTPGHLTGNPTNGARGFVAKLYP